uniref:SUEL-type lectin domain-containing protein n=1 Tax=Sinocyclocheilus anshuiensis TaxID=1608454 RepID=A0A671S6Z9_9TELE
FPSLCKLIFPHLSHCFKKWSHVDYFKDYSFFYLHVENGKIQINTANYGRTDKTTCSEGRPSKQLQNTNCYSPNALAPVSKSCNGLESCEVFATHTVFTDPCFGIYKYLAISYFCLPPGRLL